MFHHSCVNLCTATEPTLLSLGKLHRGPDDQAAVVFHDLIISIFLVLFVSLSISMSSSLTVVLSGRFLSVFLPDRPSVCFYVCLFSIVRLNQYTRLL